MPRNRPSRDQPLPNAPLHLIHPLDLPGAAAVAADVLVEVEPADRLPVFRVLRAVLAWSVDPEAATLERAPLERIERELLERGAGPLASPLGLLAGYLADPHCSSPQRIAWACACLVDWAALHHAPKTAVLFAKAAALADPENPRYAWLVGRMLRAHGHPREAEMWLTRSYRVAVWRKDFEAQGRSLSSLGNLHLNAGRVRAARRVHLRALKVAHRHGLRELSGEVNHDLFTIEARSRNPVQAEEFAAAAFRRYGREHPQLLVLVHDVAQFWTDHGFHRRALPVFTALLACNQPAVRRLQTRAGALHATGALGLQERFDSLLNEIDGSLDVVRDESVVAGALNEVGLGAIALHRWDLAESMFERALACARGCGANQASTDAEEGLSMVRLGRAGEQRRSPGNQPKAAGGPGDLLALDFIRTLTTTSREA
jgi:hypothetical protein